MAVIGWILLGILGFILFLLILILFFPISYRIEGKKGVSDPASLSAKAWWLFGFIRAIFNYPKPGKPIVKVLFFTVFGKEKKRIGQDDQGKAESQTQQTDQAGADEQALPNGQGTDGRTKADGLAGTDGQQQTDGLADKDSQASPTEHGTDDQGKTDAGDPTPSETANMPTDQSESTQAKENGKDEKTEVPHAGKRKGFLDKLRNAKKCISAEYHFYKKLWEAEDTKPFVKETLARIFHILRNLLPRKLSGSLRFGAASPDITGYIFGIYCIISSYFSKKFRFSFDPDFENEVLEAEIRIDGHFCVIVLLWDGLRIFFDRRLRKIKKRIEHHQDKMSKSN